jgi:hypothetical protein
MSFPNWWDAPISLFQISGGNCGLVAAWQVLRSYGKRVSSARLAGACGYTKRHGVFTVGLAAGLAELGLAVAFHSEFDASVGATERRAYARARRFAVPMSGPLELDELLRERRRRRIPIVFFDTPSGQGTFSPLLGERGGVLRLPLAPDGALTRDGFLACWTAPEILRQSLVVRGLRKRGPTSA